MCLSLIDKSENQNRIILALKNASLLRDSKSKSGISAYKRLALFLKFFVARQSGKIFLSVSRQMIKCTERIILVCLFVPLAL